MQGRLIGKMESRIERKQYYEILEKTQKGELDITEWVNCLINARSQILLGASNVSSNYIGDARFDKLRTKY